MSQNRKDSITLSKPALLVILLMTAVTGGALTYLLIPVAEPVKPPSEVVEVNPEPPAIIKQKTEPPQKTAVVRKPTPKPAKAKPKNSHDFVIKGLISTAGEPWSVNLIRTKLLWLKNSGKQEFLVGHENAKIQMTELGLAYQFVLKPQPAAYVSYNGGVEGNIARIIAFVDQNQDGQLTAGKDKIIAVSKELLRYRTGRYDNNALNSIQIRNIQQAGKGYVFIRNEPDAAGKMDWRVIANNSPVRLDLNAAETSLPDMYNTFLKLH